MQTLGCRSRRCQHGHIVKKRRDCAHGAVASGRVYCVAATEHHHGGDVAGSGQRDQTRDAPNIWRCRKRREDERRVNVRGHQLRTLCGAGRASEEGGGAWFDRVDVETPLSKLGEHPIAQRGML